VGKRIGIQEGDTLVWYEILGVVRDVSFAIGVVSPPTRLQFYKPLMYEPWGFLTLIVRGAVPASFKREMQHAVADIDADVAVQDLYTIPEAIERGAAFVRVINRTLSGFALLGLLLAAIGLYGVLSNIVARRLGEFGIRLVLGATPAEIFKLVLRKGLGLTLIGLVLGSIGAYALNRFLGSLMPQVAGTDPLMLALVAVVLLVVAFLACLLPARHATRVNPIEALRAE
jgi:ABC-type antimicrobial peptide transport system permease subunit